MPAGQAPPVRHAHAQGDRRRALAREAQRPSQLEGQQLVGGRHQHVAAAVESAQGELQVAQGAEPLVLTRKWLDRTAAPVLSVIKTWRPICRGPSQTALPNAATRFVAQVHILSNPRMCVPDVWSSARSASVSQR